tara:strand:+ start:16499 stop:16603 length:105 start_codon:yes stop_codon:yes gene_type:complete
MQYIIVMGLFTNIELFLGILQKEEPISVQALIPK